MLTDIKDRQLNDKRIRTDNTMEKEYRQQDM
jgi:hypothetical protein